MNSLTRARADHPVIRRIWGSIDTIALIFAGSAAEFALNKAVDWLFVTNALPDAPIERFFETVRFAQAIMFGDEQTASAAIRAVNHAHSGVEQLRDSAIPQWAYRDVLFMLIDYGERAHGIVYGDMTEAERLAHFSIAVDIGREMHIHDLPTTYADYQAQRAAHLLADTARSDLTDELYRRYRAHIGGWRMNALLDVQASLVPEHVVGLLNLKRRRRVDVLLRQYRRLRNPALLRRLVPILLPRRYAAELSALELRDS